MERSEILIIVILVISVLSLFYTYRTYERHYREGYGAAERGSSSRGREMSSRGRERVERVERREQTGNKDSLSTVRDSGCNSGVYNCGYNYDGDWVCTCV